jgi:hypothetical protein
MVALREWSMEVELAFGGLGMGMVFISVGGLALHWIVEE